MAGRTLIVLLLAFLLLVSPTAAQITAEVGETWIRFEWPAAPDTTLQIDGVDQGSADHGVYYLTDLNPNEEHQIQIISVETGTITDSARVTTLSPLTTALFFIVIEVVLALLCLLLQDPVRVVLTGALGGALGFFLFGLALGHGALWIVVLGLVGFQALFVILALYNLFEESLRWW